MAEGIIHLVTKKLTTQVELEEVVDPSQTPVVIHGTYLR